MNEYKLELLKLKQNIRTVKAFELNGIQIKMNTNGSFYHVVRVPGIDEQAPFNMNYDQADDFFEYFCDQELGRKNG